MLAFFDCNCYIGRTETPFPGTFSDVETLVGNMKKCSIAKALVWHMSSVLYHPVYGNEKILEVCRGRDMLMPVWVVMPNHTHEFYQPEELIGLMRENNVRAVRLCPSAERLNHRMETWSCGELFGALECAGIPVFISLRETDWNTVHAICAAFPALKLVLTEIHYSQTRNMFAMLSAVKNMYIDTSHLKSPYIYEDLCSRFGAERLLFGTCMPYMEPGCAVSSLIFAEISQDDKEKIASRNIRNLLEEVIF